MAIFEKHGLDERDFFRYFVLTDQHFPLHFHHAYELILVKSGELMVTVNKTEYHLKENELIFIFNNQMHAFRMVDDPEVVIMLFSPELIGDFFTQYQGMVPHHPVLSIKQIPEFEQLQSIYQQKSFLYHICAELIEQSHFSKVQHSPKTKVLHRILLYIDEHYQTDCTLKEVAKHLGYDYPYLSKLFVQMASMSFTDYLNQYRISQACYLLKNSDLMIGEIASRCGYRQLRTFHRNFNKIMQQSPRDYRKQIAANLQQRNGQR